MIKTILDAIAATGSTIEKQKILTKHKDNALLERVLYLAKSKRVKFYIKQIPKYSPATSSPQQLTLQQLNTLDALIERNITGNAASEFLRVLLTSLHADDAYVIERIIQKDLDAGLGSTLINKVFPGLIEKTPYMGAVPYSEKGVKSLLAEDFAYSQTKMDGRYANAIIRNGDVEMESREGEPTLLPYCQVIEELSTLPDLVLNGELTMKGFTRYESNGMIASIISIHKKHLAGENVKKEVEQFEKKHIPFEEALSKIEYTCWDCITVDEYFDMYSERVYSDRLQTLSKLLPRAKFKRVKLIRSKQVHTVKEAKEHFLELLSNGEEGTILKSPNGVWTNGKPKTQIKFKLEMSCDLEICDFHYGTGKNAKVISAITCKTSDGKLIVRPSGMTEEVMAWVTKNQSKLKGTILEVVSSGVSTNNNGEHSLLHPRCGEFRTDKSKADTLKQVLKIEQAIKEVG